MLVRYYGHLGRPTGYGVAAAETCMAMRRAGIDLEISTDGELLRDRYMPLARCIRDEDALSPCPDVVIVHTLPLDCAKLLAKTRIRETAPGARCIAYTTWEGASQIPSEMAESLRAFDGVWVPSLTTANLMEPLPRVWVVPHAYDIVNDDGLAQPPIETLIRPYRFYYVGAWSVRKNVEGLIRAFTRAFGADDPVELFIQASGAPRYAAQLAQIATGVPLVQQPTIVCNTERVSDHEIQLLHQRSHCFVTATRGEAWNLPAFDAMVAGRHIIAPAGMGSDSFLYQTSARLYESRLAPASGEVLIAADNATVRYAGSQGLTVHADWREPDLSALAIAMRSAFLESTTKITYPKNHVAKFDRHHVGRYIRDILQALTSEPPLENP